MSTRDFQFNEAKRENLAPKIVMSGPSGSGKTLSSLFLAYGLIEGRTYEDWSSIVYVDTENRRALYYAETSHNTRDGLVEVGRFTHVPFDPPYHPDHWVRILDLILGNPKYKAFILDSLTHEWSGPGGTLDWQRSMPGGAAAWATVSPRHQAVFDKILRAKIPGIACMREKQEHVIDKVPDGKGGEKMSVRKLGLKPEQREGAEFEFDMQLKLDHETHTATASKDCTGLLQPQPPTVVTVETGRVIANWAKAGKEPVGSRGWVAQRVKDIMSATSPDELAVVFTTTSKQGAGLLSVDYRQQLIDAKDVMKKKFGLT